MREHAESTNAVFSVDHSLTNRMRLFAFLCATMRNGVVPSFDQFTFVKRRFRGIAGGGARTHTILRSLDFESSASANSATPAQRTVKLRSSRRSSSASDKVERLQTSRWSKNFAKN